MIVFIVTAILLVIPDNLWIGVFGLKIPGLWEIVIFIFFLVSMLSVIFDFLSFSNQKQKYEKNKQRYEKDKEKDKQYYQLVIDAKDERIKTKTELLQIRGVSDKENIDLQSPTLTNPYAQALSVLIKDEVKQILIALGNIEKPISVDSGCVYDLELPTKRIKGGFSSFKAIGKQLKRTQLLKFDSNVNTIELTNFGSDFVDWLIEEGQKALYFESDTLGKWGRLSEGKWD